MGSSLILTGGVATAKTLREVITQPAHGFAVGDVLRWDAGSAKYRLAMADSAENAEVVGVVDTVDDASNFKLVYSGYLDVSTLAGITVPVLFLSGASAGKLVTTPPSSIGSVIKPVLTKANNTNGYVLTNYLGTQIGGSSTIAIDEIQPVGTISPFAGTVIPDTWLECNGTSYDIASYTELYSKIITTDGDRVPAYGYVVEISLSSGSSAIWNAITVGDTIITNATSTTPTTTSYDIIGRVLSKTASLGGSHPLTIQIFPNYSATNKNFVYPNKSPLSLTGQVKAYSSGTGDPYYAVANGTDRGGPGTINTVKIIKFNTPDMRGRVGVGVNSTNIGEWESDALISAISGNYPYGSFGGEEKHTLTTAEMPAHFHDQFFNSTPTLAAGGQGQQDAAQGANSAAGATTGTTGGNQPHNNMPPYLAVRYIIKAKPYTRAAIIDGVDLPYSNLLVRSTDSNSLRSELLSGVSGGDLVFYTNSGEASKTGTERMRVLGSGGTVVVGVTSSTSHILSANSAGLYITNSTKNSLADLYVENSDANLSTGGGITLASFVSSASGSTQRRPRLHIKATDEGIILNESYNVDATNLMFAIGNVERMRLNGTGLGVLTNSPGATLDVNGTLKVGNFGGATNVMAKPNMNAGSVGLVVPLLASAGDLNSDGVYYITSALSEGTWLVFLQGFENAGSTNDADPVWVMFKVWTVPAGNYLVFTPNNDTLSATGNSGVSYRMNTSSMQTYTTANANTIRGAPWVQLTAPADVTIAGNYNPTGTQTGIVWDGKSQALLASGYAIRIA